MSLEIKTSTPAKFRAMRDRLAQSLRDGEFAPGDRFPAEQTLAAQFGVSYMTARRAICDLVEADLLERRSRNGTYVRAAGGRRTTAATLNLITFDYESAAIRDFIREGTRIADAKGWHPNVVKLARNQQDPAVRAVRNGDMSIIMLHDIALTSALAEAVAANPASVVAMQWRCPLAGVSSVLYDEKRTVELAVNCLRKAGHRDIAIVAQIPTVETSRLQIEAWQALLAADFSAAEIDRRLIGVKTLRYESPGQQSYQSVMAYLGTNPQTTALITLGDEIAHGTLAGCRSVNQPVPDSISIVNIGDSPLAWLANPPISSIDVNFGEQFDEAVKIFSRRGKIDEAARTHVVEPKLIERCSVKPLTAP